MSNSFVREDDFTEPLLQEGAATDLAEQQQQQQESVATRRFTSAGTTGAVHPRRISITSIIADPSDSALRREYHRLLEAHNAEHARDEIDVEKNLIRERWFTVAYNKMARNKIWANDEGPECAYYDGTPGEYTHNQEIWPRGRNLDELSVYGQMKDFFLFMWSHTKPYSTVSVILLMSLARPFQVLALSAVAGYIEENPSNTPLWVFFAGFYGHALERFMYWWYEMWVPLNSQRVQLRCVLLKKRARLPHDHPMAVKWSPGRFTGLLKDVDDVINDIWANQLSMFDDLVSMIYLLILCLVNLAFSVEENADSGAYGVYVAVFLGLGVFIMILPFVWFWMFNDTLQECETMIRDGQALYMSASNNRLVANNEGLLVYESIVGDDDTERERVQNDTAVKAYWLYGRTTFRAFFHRLAWQTNYSLFAYFWMPLVAYFLLIDEGFGASFDTTNILIVLLSLKDLNRTSVKLLGYLVQMSRGCTTLRNIAEVLNAKVDDPALDLEKGLSEQYASETSRMSTSRFDPSFDNGLNIRATTLGTSSINEALQSMNEDREGEI